MILNIFLAMLFRHNTVAHIIDYSTVKTQLLYALGNQKLHVTHFMVILPLLLRSRTELTVTLRCPCVCEGIRYLSLGPTYFTWHIFTLWSIHISQMTRYHSFLRLSNRWRGGEEPLWRGQLGQAGWVRWVPGDTRMGYMVLAWLMEWDRHGTCQPLVS